MFVVAAIFIQVVQRETKVRCIYYYLISLNLMTGLVLILLLSSLDALQPVAAVVILVLPLPADHGPGPAVDDVCPPRLRGGVTPGVVESPACVCRVLQTSSTNADLCALCSLQLRRGRVRRGWGQHRLSSSHGDLEDEGGWAITVRNFVRDSNLQRRVYVSSALLCDFQE